LFVLCADLDVRGLDSEDLSYGVDETALPAPGVSDIADVLHHSRRTSHAGRPAAGFGDLAWLPGRPL